MHGFLARIKIKEEKTKYLTILVKVKKIKKETQIKNSKIYILVVKKCIKV
jgi:hypothetical protein